ncbi:MAG: hypothetical protein EO766_12035 [Hydrotalea sp. AMD]|uniref:hypothetical protein n=1 Tax=Hydrotalea sp. AMD TaxID=2501297 RepID=UPI001026458E|nr:hypothetical protein [Hydrotalea sp. AMD]RWZ87248.1 MAG: hypothetical protein EO766_12035 [Hydrotalea sp. AMD]
MTLQRPVHPSFCIIAPTAYLSSYAVLSDTHLALAHLVDTDSKYASWYKNVSEHGDFIIMDNGAFELGESYEPAKLIELGRKCGAKAIVLPDYPGQSSQLTIDAAIKWAPMIQNAGFYTMFVPQSNIGNTTDWINAYNWAAGNELVDMIGMSILGIPNALPHVPKSYARVVMTELLRSKGMFASHKYHHYLGLNAAPNVELPSLLITGSLDSCDSSNPVWFGINGFRYDITNTDYAGIQKKYMREVDFNEPKIPHYKKPHIHEAIEYNIRTTLDIFENPKKHL